MGRGWREIRTRDWSLNLEDEAYADNQEELLAASVEGIRGTDAGCYVNLVTPGGAGHPEEGFIPALERRLREDGIDVAEIRYIGECGCGGFVTRVFR
ncbi:CGCGG family putative rSAM-modified RiPP protein [Gorillibacterium sp. sgz5001074]|uniref:CGCGG family putative rSAM-modified RiPP protein n=1 Tax=Gorillibacterium sp. sgz5001074 TaxID=3446695 RepID=UPI003F66F65D